MATIPQLQLSRENLDEALDLVTSEGCLQLDNFLLEEFVHTLREYFDKEYLLAESDCPFVKVGDSRKMFLIKIAGEFSEARLFASPLLMELLSRLLGKDFDLSCFTCVTAFPGAKIQHRHRDFPGLFQTALDYFCPSYAINLFVPLIPMNKSHGTTRMWPRTHRKPLDPKLALEADCIDPEVPVGSALLMDYRTLHQGMANLSDRSRPVLCLGYKRSWFQDTVNFKNSPSVNMSLEVYEGLAESDRRLFSRSVKGQMHDAK